MFLLSKIALAEILSELVLAFAVEVHDFQLRFLLQGDAPVCVDVRYVMVAIRAEPNPTAEPLQTHSSFVHAFKQSLYV